MIVLKNNRVYRVVYAAKMRDGTYRVLEAVDWRDAKQFLGRAALSIRKRLITHKGFWKTIFSDTIRRRVWEGAKRYVA